MDLKRRTAKFIPTAQYGADITSLRHVWRQLAPDLADDTGNCSSAVFTVRIPNMSLLSSLIPSQDDEPNKRGQQTHVGS